MKESTEKSRRDFIKTASKGVLFAAVAPNAIGLENEMPTVVPKQAFGANERIRIAVLGLNSRGQNHVDELMALANKANVEIVMFCDPDMEVLQRRASEFKTKHGKTVLIEQDFRKAYDDKTIDAVTIASPNHWHALQAIWACQAGKDVYVEKPATHNLFEGRKMIEAAYKYNRIVQHGVQLRSSIAIREAVKHLQDGLIGNVYMATVMQTICFEELLHYLVVRLQEICGGFCSCTLHALDATIE
ncbi:MAG: Gfo/Idh/MocA family protein, partial [Bacteroidota bacterium]